ncbi:MAG: hypothetical protein ACO3N7_00955 [Kiritimatiellia bacterium]
MPRQKINVYESELRAKGIPLEIQDLKPDPIPVTENAAPLYLKAYQLLEKLEYEGENIFHFKNGYPAVDPDDKRREGLYTLLADPQFEEAIALIDQATSLIHCQFELDYNADP